LKVCPDFSTFHRVFRLPLMMSCRTRQLGSLIWCAKLDVWEFVIEQEAQQPGTNADGTGRASSGENLV